MNKARLAGVTLVELMIAMAVLSIIAVIAVPYYRGYIGSSHEGVLNDNIQTVRLMEKNYEVQHKTYISGSYNPSNPGATDGLKTRIGWEPRTQKDTITYVVTCETPNSNTSDPQCVAGTGYYVKATDSDGTTVCQGFAGATCP